MPKVEVSNNVWNRIVPSLKQTRIGLGFDEDAKRAGKLTIGSVIKQLRPPIGEGETVEAVVTGVEYNPTTKIMYVMHRHLQGNGYSTPPARNMYFPVAEIDKYLVVLGDIATWQPVSAEKQALCSSIQKMEAELASLRNRVAGMR